MKRRLAQVLVVATGLAALVLGFATPAQACGGFFCNNLPMDQTGEQIIFGVDHTSVTATIQISYTGSAADFAWVVPVQAKPDITLAPSMLFNVLQNYTSPQWYLDWQMDDGASCGWWPYPEVAFGSVDEDADGGGVEIVDQQQVGPYETVTLAADDGQALYDWLNDNGFVQPDSALPLIEHYVANDMLFVAMRLKQDASVGDIQPVTLSFGVVDPCVPLILTRVAAQADMPVQIWVASQDRAVPTNWFHVVLNEKKISWIDGGSNYRDVATLAIDEAAGHAFVTEFAGEQDMKGWLYTDGQFDVNKLASITDAAAFLQELLSQGFPRDAVMQGLIKKHIPKPAPEDLPGDCQSDQEFYTWNLDLCLGYMPEDWTFDPAAFVADIEERVIAPLVATQEILNRHDYLTRLLSTVSPEEMTRDPIFDFNPDLPDVSNIHNATAVGVCGDEGELESVTITLANGETFTLDGPFEEWWGWGSDAVWPDPAPEEAAAKEIQLLGTSGPPQVVDPADVKDIDILLDEMNPEFVLDTLGQKEEPPKDPPEDRPGEDPGETPDEPGIPDPVDDPPPATTTPAASGGGGGGGGCGGAGGTTPIWLALWALISLAITRRR